VCNRGRACSAVLHREWHTRVVTGATDAAAQLGVSNDNCAEDYT